MKAFNLLIGKLCLIVLFSGISLQTTLAQTNNVSGFVTDKTNGEKLIGCHLVIKDKFSGVSTDEYGFFSLNLPPGSHQIIVSYIGYRKKVIYTDSLHHAAIIIEMEPELEIPEVAVVGSIPHSLELSSIQSINPGEVNRMPSFFGERDVLRSLQLKSGVQMGKEGSSGIIVRGGSPDQNLYLVDGVPLYYVQHIGNLLSTFNPDAVNSAYFIKGGFPARYGGRLSSVVDVRLKDGNKNDVSGSWTIGTIAFKGTLECPLNDKTSLLISGRRCNLDIFTRIASLIDSDGKGMVGYTFYDANLKLRHQLNEKDVLYLSLFSNKDRVFLRFWDNDTIEDIRYKFKSVLDWGNHFGSFRLNHIHSNKSISDFSLSYSIFNYYNKIDLEAESLSRELENYMRHNGTSIHDILLKFDHNYYHSNKLNFRFGAGLNFHRFRPYSNISGDRLKPEAIYMPEFYSYVESIYKPFDQLKIDLGYRNTLVYRDGSLKYLPEPRISVGSDLLDRRLGLRLSYSRMAQMVHLISDNSGGIPLDLWIPSSDYAPGETSDQVSFGISMKPEKLATTSILLEGYYKNQHNLIELNPGNNIFYVLDNPLESLSHKGVGSMYGFEVTLEKHRGVLTGWISYMYSRNTRKFADINHGKPYPYIYEKPHTLYTVIMTRLSSKINLSLSWQFTNGNTITIPSGKYMVPVIHFEDESAHGEAHLYGPKNSLRLKPYHRMDISIDFKKKIRNGTRVFNISFYNAYNKQNPFFLFYMNDAEGEAKLHQLCLFPILPSFSYRYDF